MNLEPIRAGVAMTWESLDERERLLVAWLLVSVALTVIGWARGRQREALKRDILEELHAGRES